MITDASNYKIQFPSIEELTEKIASLNYFKFFKETDSKARGINHKYDDFLKKYNSSIMKFEDTDKSNFTSFYNDIIVDYCVGSYTIQRTWNLKDDCNNYAIPQLQLISVKDTIKPTASIPDDIYVEHFNDVPPPGGNDVLNASDNCTQNLIVEFLGDSTDGLTLIKTIVRRYRVEDLCGNAIYLSQNIYIDGVPHAQYDEYTILHRLGYEDEDGRECDENGNYLDSNPNQAHIFFK